MANHPPITLRYFDARGRAQFLRYYFKARKITFTDERVPSSDDFSAWKALRDNRSLTGPFQKLPIMHWGGRLVSETLLIASLGIYGGTGHFLLIAAFRHAAASTLAPLGYVQLIWATLLGWLIYDALPDATSFAGMAIIAAAGIALAWHARPAKS